MGNYQAGNSGGKRKKVLHLIPFYEVVKETEKAYNIKVNVQINTQTVQQSLWMPKTQVSFKGNSLYISEWILGEKVKEIAGKEMLDESLVSIPFTADQSIEE
jgi:hypothetical protein